MDQGKIISVIKDNYSWKSVETLIVLRDGPDNTVFSVLIDNIQAIVRLSKRNLAPDDFNFESEIISHFYKQMIPVAKIYKNLNDQFTTNFSNQTITIFEFLPGESTNSINVIPPPLAFSAGGTLAKIHNSTSNFNPIFKKSRNIFTEFEKILPLSQEFIRNVNNGTEIISMIKQSYDWAKSEKYIDQVIHNDYRMGNLFFLDDKVSAVLDFDWSCLGPAIKDLGLALVEWSYPDGSIKTHNENILESFLSGYNAEAKKPVLYDKKLRSWMTFSALSDACTYYFDVIQETGGLSEPITLNSYMYQKGLYFANII